MMQNRFIDRSFPASHGLYRMGTAEIDECIRVAIRLSCVPRRAPLRWIR